MVRSRPAMGARRSAGARRGMTLVEILVVLAVLALVLGIAVPSLYAVLGVQQAGAARQLATTLLYLRDEAGLRNVTFRLVFDLDAGTYKVEVGDPETRIFASPEEREAFEEELARQVKRFTKRELEEGAAAELEERAGRFEGLQDPALEGEVSLPGGSVFAFVWTPQYEEPVRPHDEPPDEDEPHATALLYIFPDGSTEQALIRIADADDPEEGFTLQVEPLTGRVQVLDELVEPDDLDDERPEPPELTL